VDHEPNDNTWHAVESEQVLAALGSSEQGLTAEDVRERQGRYGTNELPRGKGESAVSVLLRQIHNPLIYVLLAATAVAILLGKTTDGIFVFGVVVLNAVIGFIQEYRAGRAIEALNKMLPVEADVVRDGSKQTISATDLVPGDVVTLESGDQVPADLRLIETRGLRVEEAALTGESVPAQKETSPTVSDAGLGDRTCMAYSGTLVTYGTARGVVVSTGRDTELGRISAMLRNAVPLETPLTRQLGRLGKGITIGIVVLSLLLCGIGLLRAYPLADAVLAAVTMAVGAIPEGLPAVVTIALAIGVQRIAGRRAIVRKLPAVETLGSATVICSDKTGTLTRNEMTVRQLWTPEHSMDLTGVGYEPKGALSAGHDRPPDSVPERVNELLRAGLLCNDASLHREIGQWRLSGDPTEGALVVAARKSGLDPDGVRAHWARLDAVPFESDRQFMATLHENGRGETHTVYLKGAPEVILQRCRMDASRRATVTDAMNELAADGMRVLGFAKLDVGDTRTLAEAELEEDLTFLGLQGMIDPPRPEAIEAVNACREAGITVKMITGDHKETAAAIGRQLGLGTSQSNTITGSELSSMTDEELRDASSRSNVFARVAPEHKLRMVRSLQQEGHVVAMTGDGVNDAPALRQADIGVAMGITGTAVSKEAADMVLTDDNFASITAAVEEGRRVYDNLMKALAFILPTSLGLALILAAAIAFFPISDGHLLLPMLPKQILWINLVTAVALALPLAFETKEPDVMKRPPRRSDAPLLSPFILVRTLTVALLMAGGAVGMFLLQYWGDLQAGLAPEIALRESQTMAVTTVVLFQIFYLFTCRSLRDSAWKIGLWSNRWIYAGVGAVLFLQAAFVFTPGMNWLFGSSPLGMQPLGETLLVALLVVPVVSLEKMLRRRSQKNI
jgi:Ca2+-transporting ATPase